MQDNNEYINNNSSKKYFKYIIIIAIIGLLFLCLKLFKSGSNINITYKLMTNKIINQDLAVYYEVNGNKFDRIILPDGKTSYDNTGTVSISQNGTYRFVVYDKANKTYEKDFTVNNIDKEKPTGTCEATITTTNVKIIVNAIDNNKIVRYSYLDGEKTIGNSLSNEYTYNNKTSVDINVGVYDEAGNIGEIKCNVINNSYYEPILPNATDNIVYQGETDTLKVYVVKSGDNYLTRIWALDPYSQLNKAASPEYGVNMYSPKSLLNKAVANNNLYDKMIIGFNASGFYLKDIYDAASVAKYPAYDKTSVGTIVINNGYVFRNAYNKAYKQWYIMGINKDNKMVVFEDNVASSQAEIDNKKIWAESVINSGIRNTFTFAGPVIANGQRLTEFSSSMPDNSNTGKKGLQLICQINNNNFALFSSKSATRNTAIDVFASIGCQDAVNLDGGGSVALFYKDKNSSEFNPIIGGTRQMPEVGYFQE